MSQLGLLQWTPPRAAPRAADGVKRAARAGSRVDAAVLAVCRENVGREVTEADFWAAVCRIQSCVPDTARRRRDALESQGFLVTSRPEGTVGVVRIVEVALRALDAGEGGR